MSLASFAPPLALSLLSEGPILASGRTRRCAAAALFVDISGFTGLVDVMTARYGEQGAERLQELLNSCFVPIVEAVDRSGGQVLAFPGDAALCLWCVPGGPDDRAGLADAAIEAARCALSLRDALEGRRIHDVVLRFRAVVTAGPVTAVLAGGIDGQWHLVVAGPAIRQIDSRQAAVGEVVLSADAAELCGGSLTGTMRPSGWLLTGLVDRAPARGPVPFTSPRVPDPGIASVVAASVRARLETGSDVWLSEFRVVTVVFVLYGDPAVTDTLQPTIQHLQTVVRQCDGDLNQLVIDDQGLTAVVVFGSFQRTHEDDAVRAITTAHALLEVSAARLRPRIGIATGRVFMGVRGGATRRELAVIGDVVILAARFAQAADPVLCDDETYAKGRRAFRFHDAGPLRLKGKDIVRGAWRPGDPLAPAAAPLESGVCPTTRRRELALIEQQLRDLAERGEGGLIVLEGEPGIGKSALAGAAREFAGRLGLRSIAGGGESLHASTLLHAWRPIVATLMAEEFRGAPPASVTDRLVALLGEAEAEWLPLLGPVLPDPIAETPRTAQLTADSRARATRLLLDALLQRLARGGRLLIIIEDTHWIDVPSWELIEDVVAHVPGLVVLLTRRLTPEHDALAGALARMATGLRLALPAMPAGEIGDVVARRLGAVRLSDELSQWIAGRCEGNPLFGEELALMLLERGATTIADGVCGFSPEVGDEVLAALPTTVQRVLAARIDRLPASDQLTMKVASVFGRQFTIEALAAVSPMAEALDTLTGRLARIAGRGLLHVPDDPAAPVTFSHALVQEVAYSLLPFAQRRLLHRSAAEHLEHAEAAGGPGLSPVLAHHWERAEVPDKAMLHLDRASQDALRRASSYPEAEGFLSRLIALGDAAAAGPNGTPPPESRARWQRMLSEAVARQGRHTEAFSCLERGLSLLGRPMPRADWKNSCGVVSGVIARLALPLPRTRARREHPTSLEAMRLYDSLIQLLYVGELGPGRQNAALLSAVSLLRAASLGEQIGRCGELSRSYAMMANLVAMCGRQRLALRYADRAREIAEDVGDQQALFRALTMGQLPAFIFGRWPDAEARLREGLALGATLRNTHETLIAECTLGHIDLYRDRLEAARARFEGIASGARSATFVLPELWARAGLAEVWLRQDRLAEAIETAESCLALAERQQIVDQNSRFQAYGILASAHVRSGNSEAAMTAIDPAMRAAAAGAHLSFSSQAGFIGVTEALLGARDARAGEPRDDSHLRGWLRRFRVAAFCRPILVPARLHYEAVWHERHGRRRHARRRFTHALSAAERLAMPYDLRRTRRALDRLAGAESGDGATQQGA